VLLSIVVPCFNEDAVLVHFDERIRETLARLEQADGSLRHELCYVDDGSTDGTLELLRKLAERSPESTRYLSFSRNFGKEAALLAGLRAAGGDAVVLMDADLQHPPDLLCRMLELHREGHDQVVARRTREGEPAVRSALSHLYYRLANKAVDVELVDGAGDFRLLSRNAVDAVLALPEYTRFSKGLFSWIGFRTATFSYRGVPREGGRTRWRLRKLVDYGLDGVISFNDRPLRLGIYLGLTLAALAVVYALVVTALAVVNGVSVPGYVTLLAAVVGLGGLQMVMLGLVGEYIGRICYETKRRPHYLVRESSTGRDGAG
jgi:glycosyltransferase involved in cell wall biosynthesis